MAQGSTPRDYEARGKTTLPVMSASVAVESMRICIPDSIPCCLASPHRHAVDRLPSGGSSAPMALCSADFFGGCRGSTRAKRLADAESASANSNCPIRVAPQMHEHCAAQDGLADQAVAAAGGRASHAGADHIGQFGVSSSHSEARSSGSAYRLTTSCGLEYAGLSGAIETHHHLRCFGCCWFRITMITKTAFRSPSVGKPQVTPIQQGASLWTGTSNAWLEAP